VKEKEGHISGMQVKREFSLWIQNLINGGSENETQEFDHDSGYVNNSSVYRDIGFNCLPSHG
jgi:hypothetical protein